jgi:hypothetical protein
LIDAAELTSSAAFLRLGEANPAGGDALGFAGKLLAGGNTGGGMQV